ncbi:MAG: LapA family protein [Patescibacteria group bacterium]
MPKIIKLIGAENFIVAGSAPAGSEVLIYLDGSFVGQIEAEIIFDQAGSNFNFQYKGGQKLADGTHTVMVVAKDKTSLVLSAPSAEVKFTVNLLPAPTLIAPNETTVTAKVKPLIIGLTKGGSFVKIFIDGIYNGKTEILNNESNTANFAYQPFLNLSRGWHNVYAIAEDSAGRVSRMSEVLRFNIELPLPAPTMLRPAVNKNTSLSRPFIVGLAKNDSKIKIYIDKKYGGEFKVKNHPSGTASFAFKPVESLDRGDHLVYAVAVDKRGKQSQWSNIVYFSTRDSAIAQSAQEEKSDTVAKIEEPKEIVEINPEAPIISESSGVIEENLDEPAADQAEQTDAIKKLSQQDEASLEKIKNLIGDNTGEKAKTGQGMIDEGKLNQGKLRLSLVLFILFLVGVVGWLLWVNRELVKERREQNKTEDESDKDKNNQAAGGQKDKLL